MCAEYNVVMSNKKIQESLGVPLPDYGPTKSDRNKRVKFTVAAPVILLSKGQPAFAEKVFPVNPFPNSRLSGFTGDEAAGSADTDQDIRRVYEVPLWKKSFDEHPVVVPMTSFFEPVYWGKDIGTVQEFKVPGCDVFFVAGMLIKPRVPAGGPTDGFSLITHTATEQMLKYHQRLVTILKPDQALEYLSPMTARERFEYLIANRYVGELSVSKDRTMAKGWEKKISQAEAKLHREESYRAALKREKLKG